MKSTYTYAILSVNNDAYREVRKRLLAAGDEYSDNIHCDGDAEVIDLHGIALQADDMNPDDKLHAGGIAHHKVLTLTVDNPALLESFALDAIVARVIGYEPIIHKLARLAFAAPYHPLIKAHMATKKNPNEDSIMVYAKLAISARLDGWREQASILAVLHIESRSENE